MNQHEKKVVEMVGRGQAPSVDDLGQALVEVMQERNAFQSTAQDMADWLSRLVAAHVKQDTKSIKATLDEFVAKRVKIVQKTDGRIH